MTHNPHAALRPKRPVDAEQSVDDLDLLCGFEPIVLEPGGTALLPARITNNSFFLASGDVRWFRESDGAFVAEVGFFAGGGETVDVTGSVDHATAFDRLGEGDHGLEAQLQNVTFF